MARAVRAAPDRPKKGRLPPRRAAAGTPKHTRVSGLSRSATKSASHSRTKLGLPNTRRPSCGSALALPRAFREEELALMLTSPLAMTSRSSFSLLTGGALAFAGSAQRNDVGATPRWPPSRPRERRTFGEEVLFLAATDSALFAGLEHAFGSMLCLRRQSGRPGGSHLIQPGIFAAQRGAWAPLAPDRILRSPRPSRPKENAV